MADPMPFPKILVIIGISMLAAAWLLLGSMPDVLSADLSLAVDAASGSATDAGGSGSNIVPVPEPSAKTLRYYRSGNVLWIVATVWSLLVPALILFSGFSARLRDWASAVGRGWFSIIAAYVVFYLAVVYLLDLPLSWYQGFVRQHEYGLSNQSLGQWFADSLKALLVMLVIAVATIWVPYLLLRRYPRRWWLYAAIAAVPFLMLVLLVHPVLIAPLFDEFGPMQDKALEADILALADRAGIDGACVRG
jgi:STE24 endopeptidase